MRTDACSHSNRRSERLAEVRNHLAAPELRFTASPYAMNLEHLLCEVYASARNVHFTPSRIPHVYA